MITKCTKTICSHALVGPPCDDCVSYVCVGPSGVEPGFKDEGAKNSASRTSGITRTGSPLPSAYMEIVDSAYRERRKILSQLPM